jgi:hypothetical protein
VEADFLFDRSENDDVSYILFVYSTTKPAMYSLYGCFAYMVAVYISKQYYDAWILRLSIKDTVSAHNCSLKLA